MHALKRIKDLFWRDKLSIEVNDREHGSEYYDSVVDSARESFASYSESHYYFLWTIIVDRIRRQKYRHVLEIGCGPGRLAKFIMDQGIYNYVGLDFSASSIRLACLNVPTGHFIIGDARSSTVYSDCQYDILICTEVLEHIQDDLGVVTRFQPGINCIFSVPNFPFKSHVRYFQNAIEVTDRYGQYFNDLDVMALKSSTNQSDVFFLCEGIRNNVVVQ
jgi:2-polyprenyl-3-methyl-5-hydroxy-6-metoxy-1,4-benzoquinol methylase